MRAHRSVAVLPLLVILAVAPLRAAAQNIAEVQVTPETMTLRIGQRQTLFPAAFDGAGNVVPTARFTFVASNPTLLRVEADGTVIGLKPGVSKVEVRSGQRRAVVVVQVTGAGGAAPGGVTPASPAPAPSAGASAGGPAAGFASLTIDPPSVYLLPSENTRLTVRGQRSDGTETNAVHVTWRSLRPDIAAVDTGGFVIALGTGQGTIQASAAGGVQATVPVQVTAAEFGFDDTRLVLLPDDFDTVTAIVPTQGRRPLQAGLQWGSTNAGVIRVGPTGIVQALAPGQAEIVATGFFQERHLPVVVIPPVKYFALDPHPSAGTLYVPLTGTRAIKASARSADSTVIKDAPLRWEVGDSSIAGFDPATGIVSGRREGTTSIALTLRGYRPLVWTIQVVASGLAFDRPSLALRPGDRTTIAARLTDESGRALGPAPDLRWTTSRPEVASIGPDGAVVAGSYGSAELTATLPWGKSATVRVVVVGDALIVSTRRDGVPGIYQFTLAGADNWTPLLVGAAPNIQGTLSPDRMRIAFSSNSGGNFDIYVMDADGSNVKRLTSDPATDNEPAWTPDGQQIAFTSLRSGVAQVYLVNADGSDVRQLTSSVGGNGAAQVSPDGGTIAFLSSRTKSVDVYLMDATGDNQRPLTATKERETAVRFFPNGDLAIAGETPRSDGYRIVRQPAAGGVAAVVTTSPLFIPSFALSRDGHTLLVLTARSLDAAKNKGDYALTVQPAEGGAGTPVRLTPGEQLQSPSF